ncbi:MAG: hypothetical protein H8E40_03170 [Chloroflexi bacterium]|nr:hypothetical protein [Chloroflexota bacterium]
MFKKLSCLVVFVLVFVMVAGCDSPTSGNMEAVRAEAFGSSDTYAEYCRKMDDGGASAYTLSKEIWEIGKAELDAVRAQATAEAATPNVWYKVSGSKGALEASLTIQTPDGTSQQDVRLPWQQNYTFKPSSFIYLSAQNKRASGCIKVEIFARGKLLKEVESCGAYVIATASDTFR